MPTGYTASVADGDITELRDFALLCARGMSALITLREEPFRAPIPDELVASTKYYDERLPQARARLAELSSLTEAEAEARAKDAHAFELRVWAARQKEREAIAERYRAMIAKVEAWTTDAEGIRDFMLQQLREGLRFDGSFAFDPEPRPMTGVEWSEAERKKAARDVGYLTEEREKEIARTAMRNRWLRDLRRSLPGSPGSPSETDGSRQPNSEAVSTK